MALLYSILNYSLPSPDPTEKVIDPFIIHILIFSGGEIMPKSETQKLKTLYVAKFFMENSDENHSVSAGDIIDYLKEECDITADRRSIYRDIAALRDVFGMDIDGGQGGRYRLMSRQFHIDDLKTLAECVRAAKFISHSKSNEIISSLEFLCSIYEADELKADVFLVDRVKTTQKGTLNILSTIHSAMARRVDGKPHEPQKISFKYLHYTINDIHSSLDSRKGSVRTVSPYRLILNDGYYYLLSFDDKYKEMRTFRVDRMKDVQLMDCPREGADEFSTIDMKQYTQRVFGMYSGDKYRVELQFTNDLINAVYDRFGKAGDVFYHEKDSKHFTVSVEVETSPQFYGWICSFGNKAQILQPKTVRNDFRQYLGKISCLY
ncbi:MAG: WYL domain-containing protein [Oscillospiraceae bacterium]|nr:WYL domain-containing protein [Oscillospiraceae bacterium]